MALSLSGIFSGMDTDTLVSQLVAECNERARAALGNQGAMKDPVQPLPFRIVFELLCIERSRRSAQPVMSHDKRFLPLWG